MWRIMRVKSYNFIFRQSKISSYKSMFFWIRDNWLKTWCNSSLEKNINPVCMFEMDTMCGVCGMHVKCWEWTWPSQRTQLSLSIFAAHFLSRLISHSIKLSWAWFACMCTIQRVENYLDSQSFIWIHLVTTNLRSYMMWNVCACKHEISDLTEKSSISPNLWPWAERWLKLVIWPMCLNKSCNYRLPF